VPMRQYEENESWGHGQFQILLQSLLTSSMSIYCLNFHAIDSTCPCPLLMVLFVLACCYGPCHRVAGQGLLTYTAKAHEPAVSLGPLQSPT
jgi:hypothetical protein